MQLRNVTAQSKKNRCLKQPATYLRRELETCFRARRSMTFEAEGREWRRDALVTYSPRTVIHSSEWCRECVATACQPPGLLIAAVGSLSLIAVIDLIAELGKAG